MSDKKNYTSKMTEKKLVSLNTSRTYNNRDLHDLLSAMQEAFVYTGSKDSLMKRRDWQAYNLLMEQEHLDNLMKLEVISTSFYEVATCAIKFAVRACKVQDAIRDTDDEDKQVELMEEYLDLRDLVTRNYVRIKKYYAKGWCNA